MYLDPQYSQRTINNTMSATVYNIYFPLFLDADPSLSPAERNARRASLLAELGLAMTSMTTVTSNLGTALNTSLSNIGSSLFSGSTQMDNIGTTYWFINIFGRVPAESLFYQDPYQAFRLDIDPDSKIPKIVLKKRKICCSFNFYFCNSRLRQK